MSYFSKRPSSTSTRHLPQVAFSAQIDSISTPSSRAAARREVPSSTCPRRPEGWRITVCFLVIGLGWGVLGCILAHPLQDCKIGNYPERQGRDHQPVVLARGDAARQ